ncbi:MAG: cell division ATP-binding protein FtsE [Nitrospiraceae bacterium]|nr:MAG: cell division ATP-binding protein FtsE [Nitrospiraceae bacterium]
MILFSDVSKRYDKKPVLNSISLIIKKGELLFITGPSGAGKTTMLKLIYCSERPDSGHITVSDWEVSKLGQSEIPELRRNIGIIFQDFKLLTNRTVFDNVALALSIHGMNQGKIRHYVNEALEEVKLLDKASLYPQFLSGGEQQRVVIARAMVSKPVVLLADEPTGDLDVENAKTIMELFSKINGKGTTVLIATHDENLFRNSGHRVVHINDHYIEKEYVG